MLRRRSARLITFPAYLDVCTTVVCLLGCACVLDAAWEPWVAGVQLGSKLIDHVDLLRQIRFKVPSQWIGGLNGSLVLAVGRAMGGH